MPMLGPLQKLFRFPVDEQYCQVKFESFGFTNKQVWMLEPLIKYVSLLVLPMNPVVYLQTTLKNKRSQLYSEKFQIQFEWMDLSQSNVNTNISLAQFVLFL